MKLFLRFLSLTALVGMLALPGASRAEAVNVKKGHLVIEDSAEMFSEKGKEKARDEFAHLMTKSQREVTIATMTKLSDDDKAKLDKAPASEKKTFWVDLAKKRATGTHGVYVLICRSPGEVVLIADKEMRDKGFKTSHEDDVRDILLKGLRESAKEKTPADQVAARDKALFAAVESLEKNLPGASKDTTTTTKTTTTTRNGNNAHNNVAHNNDAHNDGAKGSGMGIGGWICIGLVALLGIWLVVGLVRSFTGGGGGGYGGGGGGMMGGGGGGFFPSLMGGLFGAAAGMWMYDHFFGGHSSAAYGGDTYNTTNNYGEQVNDQGAGDYSGDAGSAGSYDDDQGGGGGGDGGWGGGGDFGGGGGGGDWGGGGGDF